jgi:DNA-binding GntR family transcriptional regulator
MPGTGGDEVPERAPAPTSDRSASDDTALASRGEASTRNQIRRLSQFSAPLRARIAQDLRDRILTGTLAAGVTLGLDELAGYYGSSRTPVREALIELEHDGLVQILPRSGVKVVGMSSRELLDNFALFAALSGVAAQWAAERMTPEELDHVRALNGDVERATAAPHQELVVANWRFHRAINQLSRSSRIATLIRRTARVVPVRFFDLVPDQTEITLVEHAQLLAAFADRDGARAREIAEAHVAEAGELLARRLAEGVVP